MSKKELLAATKQLYNYFMQIRFYVIKYGAFPLVLSWIYAVASQIIIPLPFNHVPISLQPMPVFLCTLLFGWQAVYAYGFYLLQGALGAPFFAGMMGGLSRLLGPTGGYLIGFGLSAIFLAWTNNAYKNSLSRLIVRLFVATSITFLMGMVHLSFFVSTEKVFIYGLFPFIIGDFLLKPLVVVGLNKRFFSKF